MQPPLPALPPPPYPPSAFTPPGDTQPPPMQGYPAPGSYAPPSGYMPPYPPPYPTPYMGYLPPPKRRVPWWGQVIALLVPPPIAMVVGYPVLGLLLWFTVGDSPTPPLHADRVMNWMIALYVCTGVLLGLGVHAIVIRKPWIFLAGFAVTVAVFGGTVWAYTSLF